MRLSSSAGCSRSSPSSSSESDDVPGLPSSGRARNIQEHSCWLNKAEPIINYIIPTCISKRKLYFKTFARARVQSPNIKVFEYLMSSSDSLEKEPGLPTACEDPALDALGAPCLGTLFPPPPSPETVLVLDFLRRLGLYSFCKEKTIVLILNMFSSQLLHWTQKLYTRIHCNLRAAGLNLDAHVTYNRPRVFKFRR